METLADHPDRERLIAQEMGWDHLVEDREADRGHGPEAGADDRGEDDPAAAELFLVDDDDELECEAGPAPLSDVPAYAKAFDLATLVLELAQPLQGGPFKDPRHEEAFAEAVGNALIPAAKIRGGHAFGYDEQICGNIVQNRFALEAAEASERALLELQAAGAAPAGFIDQVLPRVREVKQLVEERIAEMRRRVWWGAP